MKEMKPIRAYFSLLFYFTRRTKLPDIHHLHSTFNIFTVVWMVLIVAISKNLFMIKIVEKLNREREFIFCKSVDKNIFSKNNY